LFFPNKKPAIDWQSRVFWKFCYLLENFTHDAKRPRAAMPNGHASLDLLRVLLRCKRVCHSLTAPENIILAGLSKKFHFPFGRQLCIFGPRRSDQNLICPQGKTR
jgi:hypothetical protein